MNSAEHQKLVEGLNLHFADTGDAPAATTILHGTPYQLPHRQTLDPVQLTYGQVVSLGGDFYAPPNQESISLGSPDDESTQVGRFRHAVQSLEHGDRTKLTKILATMSTEITGLAAATDPAKPHGPHDASAMYAKLGDTLNLQWNVDTGGGIQNPTAASTAIMALLTIGPGAALKPLLALWAYKIPAPRGEYMLIANTNWDHFGADAIASYQAGHKLACNFAAVAALGFGSAPAPAAKHRALEHAYLINAFADHFLTDLFSAGHLRVPRKPLQEASMTTGLGVTLDAALATAMKATLPIGDMIGGLLAKAMHDEDSASGLKVHNLNGDEWTAYGDSFLYDAPSTQNLSIIKKAVQASIDEVWQAFQNPIPYDGNPDDPAFPAPMNALRYIPVLADVNKPQSTTNPAPLFILDGTTVKRRANVNDRTKYQYIDDWYSLSTLALLHTGSLFPN